MSNYINYLLKKPMFLIMLNLAKEKNNYNNIIHKKLSNK